MNQEGDGCQIETHRSQCLSQDTVSPQTIELSLKECMSSPGNKGRKGIPGKGHISQTSHLASLQGARELGG